ncbi:hypothetical protein BOO86_15890 [Mycobacterium sp. CBMA 234]|uniref:fibronectin-binding protein n=1 Tax=Mycolicibacterium sp. CBMA 234 TaxID=1918495 RepID=UPI0012DFD074|nr:fibronectin-binding protein [Mycolicibacterium sp. CBMA 234]MUL65958.1 hypothetical protein [Mycolicibacterium sp. CBMA 234]
MRPISRFAAVLAAAAVAVGLAAPAQADTDGPRCPLTMFIICAAIPSMPDLDHDVDLTKNSDVIDVTAAPGGGDAPQP